MSRAPETMRMLAAAVGVVLFTSAIAPLTAAANANDSNGGTTATADAGAPFHDLDAGNGREVDVVTPGGDIIELPAEVARDATVEVTNEGVLITEPATYGPFLPHETLDALDAAQSGRTTAEAPGASEAFTLHSRPGANLTIFLDFDGHTTTGTPWNTSPRPATFTSAPYSRNADPAFDTTEREYIGRAWEMVAEDFAPFNVDVTTEDPGDARLRRDSYSDTQYGIRVVISPTTDWYGNSGGVAYINSFTWINSGAPAFVFSSNLGNGYWKYIGEAASHEAGHSLGLYHDGIGSENYYTGHGSGANGWAPIMGIGYSKAITQWSRGEYYGATETQDDMAILTGRLGSSTPGGSLVGGATTVSFSSTTSDLIEQGGVSNEYTVVLGSGVSTFTVAPSAPASNLLANVALYRGAQLIAQRQATSASGWSHTIVESLTADIYTVRVTSLGWLTANDGFTEYASVGGFVLTVSGVDPNGVTGTTTTTSTTVPGSTTTTTTVPGATTTTTTPPTTVPGATTTTTPPSTAPPTTRPPVSNPVGDRLTAIAPQRILDTRFGTGGSFRLGAGTTIRVPVTANPLVPSGSTAVVVNVAAVSPASAGFIEVTPCTPTSGAERTAALTFSAGLTVGNSSIAKLDGSGDLCIYSPTPTDVVVDVTGWLGPNGEGGLVPQAARRVVDTRESFGISRSLRAFETVRVDLRDAVPSGAQAVALHIAAVDPSASGFVTAFPCSQGRGLTSSLNFSVGVTRGNSGIFAVDADRSFCLYAEAATDVVIDVTGHFETNGLSYIASDPTRVLDTRSNGFRMAAGSSVSYEAPAAPHGLTAAAESVVIFNVDHTAAGFVTSWNCGPRPTTAALTTVPFEANAGGAIASLNEANRSCLYASASSNLVVDFQGWWV